ncbi:unnamed protein product [Moneuplotes crassus]|uniref:Uncharacterized protein n=1 Tax=Euplotes crassus TaxID=5936 RepID=A0A7S3KP82_EUPCR|nr:unnamed protein product [Moneuplotes crassus]|mmetsp:Transcript_34675/g.34302  ORF Transcript_34675/g.34302 Transcript_34675/m.34302 type:complete len:132 (+) Transcript_34675:25-420(+)|eukprot:CAMPEP_0197003712 /NCGR_PEP_ID=MMETSP1380-20130617/11985_1 /TAXON_ID=5936 /ORGANISM="Euplotes crassus, Strain CT5" /LENGTH=131 /DNA_ID=CAMNT_0042422291 /DNA_START=13 /DNA_END=408 /DNA_ORIENTATION=-
MGNNLPGEEDHSDDSPIQKIDKKDPKIKKQKTKAAIMKKKTASKAEPAQTKSGQTFQASEAMKSSDFAPDPELDQGFPEDKVEFSTKPCLEGIEDDYTKDKEVKRFKKKKGNGVEEAYEGDSDFAEPEVVN